MNKKKKKKNDNEYKQKILKVQDTINTFSQFITIPQLSDDIDYNIVNDTKGFNTIISNEFYIFNNEVLLYLSSLTCGRKMSDLLNKTKIINIFPSDEQKNTLLNWMDSYIDTYNKVLEIIKSIRKELNKEYNTVFKYNEIDFELDFNDLKKDFFDFKEQQSIKNGINKHILDYAIKDALSALDSVQTNLDKGNIKKTRLRYLKKSKPNKILKIEKMICSENGFCTSKLGKILKSSPFIKYKNDVEQVGTLKYDSIRNKFTFHLKYEIKKPLDRKTERLGIFDPGLRTFLTGISNDYIIEYGVQIGKRIKKVLNKMDKIKSKKMVNNKQKYYIKHPSSTKKIIKNKRKHLLKYERYLSNYINDVHRQIISDMIKRFDYITIGNFSTKNMVETDKTSKMNKRIGNSLKLYQFKQKLKYKCLINGCKYRIVNEFMTTKCCSNCSKINNEINSQKEFECSYCDHNYDRDINASKNILMKCLKYE